MKIAVCAGLLAASLAGCVVQPAVVEPAVGMPPGVVYVAPSYAMPGPGYAWRYHPRHGWGYYHPRQGWHRGWR